MLTVEFMENKGRIQKSAKNIVSGVVFRLVSILTAFIVRTVFIKCLGNEYLSVNGLYSSILSMLSLAELGFGTAMVYSMYKPLADRDYEKLAQLMDLYKKAYSIIGKVILVAGLCLVPFLDLLIKNKPDIPGLTFYYLLFLGNSVISYWFFAYRSSVLQADQRASVISNYSSVFNLIKTVLQIVVLLVFHNFTIYLLTQIVCTILQNTALALKVKKDYPIFGKHTKSELPAAEKKKIFSDVRALMIQKVSFRVLNTSDSLIISAFVGINWVGLLSNFILVEEAVVAVLSQIFGAITASMGNFFAKESKEDGYRLFQRLDFMNHWLYGFSAIALVTLLNPFVELWLGKDYTVDQIVVVALCTRFFVEGYMNLMSSMRSTMGLFTQGKYLPLLVAALNIGLSIGLSYPLGIAGVLFATPLSRCIINVWYMPLVIHRDGFNKKVSPFYGKLLAKVALLSVIVLVMHLISYIVFSKGVTIMSFIVMTCITAVVPNAIMILLYHRTDEYRYFKGLVMGIFREVISRFLSRLSRPAKNENRASR